MKAKTIKKLKSGQGPEIEAICDPMYLSTLGEARLKDLWDYIWGVAMKGVHPTITLAMLNRGFPIRIPSFELGDVTTMEGLAQANERILQMLADGKLGPQDARIITETIESRRRILESLIIEKRMGALEAKIVEQIPEGEYDED
jgi:hypothetical protein